MLFRSQRIAILAGCLTLAASSLTAETAPPRVRPWRHLDTFSRTGQTDIGLETGGDAIWRIAGDEQAGLTANPFRLIGRMPEPADGQSPSPGVVRFGSRKESRFIFDLSAHFETDAQIALRSGGDPVIGCAVRVVLKDGLLSLTVVDDGAAITKQLPKAYATTADAWLRLRLVAFDSYAFLSVDGLPLATVAVDTGRFSSGQPELTLISGSASFDDVSINPAPAGFDPDRKSVV